MDEAADYCKRANKLRYQHFGRGYASEKHKAPLPTSTSAAAPAGLLPPKKNRKRQHSASPPAVASPAPPRTYSKPRMSLMDKWFPGTTLKQATVEACHAPPGEYVAATVERVTSAREAMLLLRAGVEDLETVLAELQRQLATTSRAVLTADQVEQIVSPATAPGLAEALAQFAKAGGHSVPFVRSQLRRVMRRKARLHGAPTQSVKRWHEFLNTHGPEAGEAPTTRELIWPSTASVTAFFVVLTKRFLEAATEAGKIAAGEREPDVGVDNASQSERQYYCDEVLSETDGQDAPGHQILLDNTNADKTADGPQPNTCWLVATQLPCTWAGGDDDGGEPLSNAQCKLLAFLRALMPAVEHETGDGDGEDAPRRSSGYGQWLLACLVALDTPLVPDTDRLVHELFRTCCDQLRVLGEWKGVNGDQSGALLDQLRREEQEVRTASSGDGSVGGKTYGSLADVGKEELLALYTIIIVLAKLFRQNQNRLIPL